MCEVRSASATPGGSSGGTGGRPSRSAAELGHFSGETLADLARLIWPDGQFTVAAAAAVEADVVVGVGGVPADIGVGVDAEGAVVVVDGTAPIESDDAVFAALAAAAIACAQIASVSAPSAVPSSTP
jgi:hypothetical protein